MVDVGKLTADFVQVFPEVALGGKVLFLQVGDFAFCLLVLLQGLGEVAEEGGG